jgi:catechol 2,3-dioxygenase-like lactoylglutathione lyase family enzyme
MTIHITHALHTAILVSDLDAATQFYGGVLGLSPVERSLKYPGIWYQLGAYQLHLIVDATVPSGLQNTEKWGRNRHIALAVSHLDSAKAHLEAAGYAVQMSASGRPALFTHDPDGNVVELTELPS